jgi:myo-inositol-1(or 4)-monophosphatase
MEEVLIKCLYAAGGLQKKYFYNIGKIKQKEIISSVVTEVDYKCDDLIIQLLKDNHPDHNILTEENGFIDNQSNLTWIVDPLDGTSNYAAGLPWFGVLICLMENDLPLLSGAYIPLEDKLYLAEKGKGSFLNGVKLSIQDKLLKDSLIGFSTDFTENIDYLQEGLNTYKILVESSRNVRTTNCLIDLLNTVENKYGACINLFNGIWDIAAPYLIIKEAGGVIKDLGNNDIKFEPNTKNLTKNYPVIAGSEKVTNEILELKIKTQPNK